MYVTLLTTTLFIAVLSAQNIRMGTAGERVFLTAPMVGRGSTEDPKRPAFVREAGVEFRYLVSDDGTMALVAASPRNLAELQRLERMVRTEPRARIFRPERDPRAVVEAQFRRLKRDFDPESFGRLKLPEPRR